MQLIRDPPPSYIYIRKYVGVRVVLQLADGRSVSVTIPNDEEYAQIRLRRVNQDERASRCGPLVNGGRNNQDQTNFNAGERIRGSTNVFNAPEVNLRITVRGQKVKVEARLSELRGYRVVRRTQAPFNRSDSTLIRTVFYYAPKTTE